jgi:hypothetical protein
MDAEAMERIRRYALRTVERSRALRADLVGSPVRRNAVADQMEARLRQEHRRALAAYGEDAS